MRTVIYIHVRLTSPLHLTVFSCANPEGGQGDKIKNLGFLSNTGPNPMKTKPISNVGPSSAHQRNTISLAGR